MAKPLSELLKRLDPEVVAKAREQAKECLAQRRRGNQPPTVTNPVASPEKPK
ncbi:hypothetical protein [Halomonas sp. NO4]|uniref:hypothetical protein n=1 Tax=Halomonas sp. NO4 TaxID=2484813 RepID=UPI0013D1F562|nr:hypothetical protein [Halomonas sp. NO4]